MSIGLTGELTVDIYVRYLRNVDASRADKANTSCAVVYCAFPLTKKPARLSAGRGELSFWTMPLSSSIEVGQPK
jgi:hypothetical protein